VRRSYCTLFQQRRPELSRKLHPISLYSRLQSPRFASEGEEHYTVSHLSIHKMDFFRTEMWNRIGVIQLFGFFPRFSGWDASLFL